MTYLFGVAYGIGLYIVGDYLWFHRFDAVRAAEAILQEEDDDAA